MSNYDEFLCILYHGNTLKAKQNMEWPSKQKTKHPPLGLCKISSMHNVNQKSCQRWWWRRNGHAICLKFFPIVDIFLILQIAQKEEHKSPHLKAITLAPTLNGPRKVVN